MPNRRTFLIASGVGLAVLAGGWAPRPTDSTWLVYAPDLEQFWAKSPFLERIKKASDAGFSRYEFGRWHAKNIDAIAKANEELGLQTSLFTGYPGLRGARWKDGLLDAATDSSELGPKLGTVKAGVMAAERDEKVERADQVADLVDALKEASEKIAETEAVLILEPVKPIVGRPTPLITTVEEAAEVVKAVGSDRVKFAFPIDRASALDPILPGRIQKLKDQAGYYRLVDFAPPDGPGEAAYARVLRTIHDVGYLEPIGLGLAPKGDPSAAIEAIRKVDAASKAL